MDAKTWDFTAQTDIWTGDIDGRPERLITTGLLGSIRWWFEVLVRGLEGYACDPSAKAKTCQDRKHCVVCELFGCTGWARKFRFDVLDDNDRPQRKQIKKDDTFRLRFTPLRPIRDEEWALLDFTLRLIADYGAIGGKTVYKPTKQPALANAPLGAFDDALVLKNDVRDSPLQKNDNVVKLNGKEVVSKEKLQKFLKDHSVGDPVQIEVIRRGSTIVLSAWSGHRHHQDLGLVAIHKRPDVPDFGKEDLRRYLSQETWRESEYGRFSWASLEHFWFVGDMVLARENTQMSSFNCVLGREESKRNAKRLVNGEDATAQWLAGGTGRSKKVFSFRDPARTFGFVKPGTITHDGMFKRLKSVWPDMKDGEYVRGGDILDKLLEGREEVS